MMLREAFNLPNSKIRSWSRTCQIRWLNIMKSSKNKISKRVKCRFNWQGLRNNWPSWELILQTKLHHILRQWWPSKKYCNRHWTLQILLPPKVRGEVVLQRGFVMRLVLWEQLNKVCARRRTRSKTRSESLTDKFQFLQPTFNLKLNNSVPILKCSQSKHLISKAISWDYKRNSRLRHSQRGSRTRRRREMSLILNSCRREHSSLKKSSMRTSTKVMHIMLKSRMRSSSRMRLNRDSHKV